MAKNKTKKDVYYFPHDYNPTSDPKMLAFVGEYGAVGYGIYWRIIEMLHECSEHYLPLKKYIYSAIAKQMLTDVEYVLKIVESCINDYELFESDNNNFWCNRVNRNVEKMVELIGKKKKGGEASAEARRLKKQQEEEKKNNEHNLTHVQHSATGVQQSATHVEQMPTGVQHNSTEVNKLNNIKLNNTKEKEIKINNSINNNIDTEIQKPKYDNPTSVSDENLQNVTKNINLSNLDYDTKKKRLSYFKEHFLQSSETEKKDFCSGHKMLLERLERAINDYNLHLLTEKNSLPFNYVFYKEWFNTWLKGLSTAEFDIYMTRIRRN